MALIQTSNLVNDIRGSVGGVTFSRSRAGAVVQSKRSPRSQKIKPQESGKVPVTVAAQLWRSATDSERKQWNQLALDYPVTNRLGQSTRGSGYQLFCKVQTYRIQAGLPTVLGVVVDPRLWETTTVNPRIVLGPSQFRRSSASSSFTPDQVLIYGTAPKSDPSKFGKGTSFKYLENRPGSFWLGSNFSALLWFRIQPLYATRLGYFFKLKLVSLSNSFTWPLRVDYLTPDIDP